MRIRLIGRWVRENYHSHFKNEKKNDVFGVFIYLLVGFGFLGFFSTSARVVTFEFVSGTKTTTLLCL